MKLQELSEKIRRWAKSLKNDILSLWFCQKHPDMPLTAKILAIFVVAYAFSPIDLIPDFIPVIGYLDDMIIVPIGIYFTLKLIPEHVIADGRLKASNWMEQQNGKPKNWLMAVLVIFVWFFLAYQLWQLVTK